MADVEAAFSCIVVEKSSLKLREEEATLLARSRVLKLPIECLLGLDGSEAMTSNEERW